jgi:hypothetical protein
MRSPTSVIENEAHAALASAQTFLLARQDRDGLWCDYDLEPGPSEAWTTACVGHALLRGPDAVEPDHAAIRAAAAAVLSLRGPSGWGYNRLTAADADSTAWTIRFLAASGRVTPIPVDDLTRPFLAPSGRARTFQPPERFGSWADEHDEVTAMVGLAYVAAGNAADSIARLRQAIIGAHDRASCWRTFWWTTPAYASAVNLEFLGVTGGVPGSIAESERSRLRSHDAHSMLELALCLAAASHLRAPDHAERFLEGLLAQRLDDGSWPSSRVLRVPAQRDARIHTLHADERRLFGTAQAVAAIKLWMSAF